MPSMSFTTRMMRMSQRVLKFHPSNKNSPNTVPTWLGKPRVSARVQGRGSDTRMTSKEKKIGRFENDSERMQQDGTRRPAFKSSTDVELTLTNNKSMQASFTYSTGEKGPELTFRRHRHSQFEKIIGYKFEKKLPTEAVSTLISILNSWSGEHSRLLGTAALESLLSIEVRNLTSSLNRDQVSALQMAIRAKATVGSVSLDCRLDSHLEYDSKYLEEAIRNFVESRKKDFSMWKSQQIGDGTQSAHSADVQKLFPMRSIHMSCCWNHLYEFVLV